MEIKQVTPSLVTSKNLTDFRAGKPGIYEDIPEGEYHKLDAMSNSRMSVLDQYAPARLKWQIDEREDSSTDSQRVGTLFHQLLLEPKRFALSGDPSQTPRYTWHVWPEGQAFRSNADKALRDEYHKHIGEDRCIRFDDYEKAKAMVASAKKYLIDEQISLDRPKLRELSLIWVDQATGLLAKGRLDILFTDDWDTVDLKSTRSAQRKPFRRDIKNYGYHRQGPWYHSGLFELGVAAKDHILFCVENEPPYLCAWRPLGKATMAQGWTEIERLRALYAECKRNDNWPGYAPGPIELDSYHIESDMSHLYDPMGAI